MLGACCGRASDERRSFCSAVSPAVVRLRHRVTVDRRGGIDAYGGTWRARRQLAVGRARMRRRLALAEPSLPSCSRAGSRPSVVMAARVWPDPALRRCIGLPAGRIAAPSTALTLFGGFREHSVWLLSQFLLDTVGWRASHSASTRLCTRSSACRSTGCSFRVLPFARRLSARGHHRVDGRAVSAPRFAGLPLALALATFISSGAVSALDQCS